jgi:ribonuclease R
MVEIIEQPNRHSQPIGQDRRSARQLCRSGHGNRNCLRKHDLPFEFSPKVAAETKALPDKVRKTEWAGRKDLRDLPLVTIDGETAKDFDDAVFAEKDGRGWRLVVAIADVSHYVRPGMALDREAMERGNSVYFPRRVIPMLPEKLSNGLCSLNPDVERLAMVCDMNIGSTGKIKTYAFYPAVFRSKARLTYNQVWSWLDGGAQPENEVHRELLPQLQSLYALFKVLLKARHKRGAIDFETIETMMLFNDQGKIENIVPVQRNDAHRLIEECMLAANVCASAFLQKHKQACLYRIHEGPTPEKLEALRSFLQRVRSRAAGAARTRRPRTTARCSRRSRNARTRSCCRRSCCVRCARRCTARTTWAISGFPTSTTRTSPRRSGAIPICSCIARSRLCSKARAIRREAGTTSACTVR